MKIFLSILTIGLIVIGFLVPVAWIFALITGVIALLYPPSGKRADGKARTGGLLGGFWDDFQVSKTMTDCPFCKSKIKKEAVKCPNCHEWVKEQKADSKATHIENEAVSSPGIKDSLSKIGALEAIILFLVVVIIFGFMVGK